jgi:hypothetical protein
MPDKSIIEKLIDRAPLAVIVVGVFVFILGAAGGLPIGNPPLQVSDYSWRIALGVMGLILAVSGLLLLSKEKNISDAYLVSRLNDYGIRIDNPVNGARLGEDIDISGSYKIKPPDGTLRLFTIATDGGWFWPQTIAQFDLAKKKWHGKVKLGGSPRYSIFIVAALVDQSGHAMWNYYYKVGEKTNWTPIDAPFTSYAIECDKITVERV